MAKFRYSLQSILDIKLKMETQAKQEFSIAKNILNEEKDKLEILFERKKKYEDELRRLLNGTLNMLEIEMSKEATLRMDEYIQKQQEKVIVAENRLNIAREHLAEVMKERKTHEVLRDKAFEEFVMEENKKESKVVDELTSYTYGRKRQVEH